MSKIDTLKVLTASDLIIESCKRTCGTTHLWSLPLFQSVMEGWIRIMNQSWTARDHSSCLCSQQSSLTLVSLQQWYEKANHRENSTNPCWALKKKYCCTATQRCTIKDLHPDLATAIRVAAWAKDSFEHFWLAIRRLSRRNAGIFFQPFVNFLCIPRIQSYLFWFLCAR